MRIGSLVLLAVVGFAVSAQAATFTSAGVGGGGWVFCGAFHPTNSNTILVGSDVSGVYRTDDFGASWRPWRTGLPSSHELKTDYVQDVLGISYQSTVYFYAATFGGIYRAESNGSWLPQTHASADTCYWNKTDFSHADAIPFSCLANVEDYLVAGAGRARFSNPDYETKYYPGVQGDIEVWPSTWEQYTVWTCDLSSGSQWTPDASSHFGAARDISVATVNDTTYIAVATHSGIYLKKPSGWMHFQTVLEDSLDCWSIHLTPRGTLYAAFRHTFGSDPFSTTRRPTGAYRIFDAPHADSTTAFTLIGDNTVLPGQDDHSWDIVGYGRNSDLMYLTVTDGQDEDPDRLLLATVTTAHGTFRCEQPYSEEGTVTWEHMTWKAHGTEHYYNNGAIDHFDGGWLDWIGYSNIMFPLVVSPSDPNKILMHNNSRMIVSTDGGDTWAQRYTTGSDEAGWTSRGYNEICVYGLDFLPDGRVVEGTGDCGTFLATSSSNAAFQAIHPTLSPINPGPDEIWNPESGRVHVRPDWNGEGRDAIFVIVGDAGGQDKLFRYRDDSGTQEWTNITTDLPADANHFNFDDFTFVDDQTCFLTYKEYSARVDTVGSERIASGVLRGTYSDSTWTWSRVDDGLHDSQGRDKVPVAIAYNPYSDRIMLACAFNYPISGGLFYLDGAEDDTWTACFDGSSGNYRDFRAIAFSSTGTVMYAGTRGRSGCGIGTVLRCENPGATPMTWTALANTSVSDMPFGFIQPFWAVADRQTIGWSTLTSNQVLTHVTSIVVDPADDSRIFVGLQGETIMPQVGLWCYDGSDWHHWSDGEPFEGSAVSALTIQSLSGMTKLIVGTGGLELYKKRWATFYPGQGKSGAQSLSLLPTAKEGPLAVRFELGRAGPVTLSVYDVRGRLVRNITQEMAEPGVHVIVWDGRDQQGRRASSAVYLAKLRADNAAASKKLLLVR